MTDKSYIQELTSEFLIKKTSKGNNEIYLINAHNAPKAMNEIGRLRELTFTESGGGTGKELDIDEFDTSINCYQQLIVFSPEHQEIIGGYRFIDCRSILPENGTEIALSTTHYFNFSDQFVNDYLPYTMELGRSWVQPKFQPVNNLRLGLYALDNIWDGLGALVILYPHIKYFFGKVTMYPNYDVEARNTLLSFLQFYFADQDNLVWPMESLAFQLDTSLFKGLDYKEGFKKLNSIVRSKGEVIPPLINIYMNLSPTMKTFGTAINADFGNVEETGILLTIEDIHEEKKLKYVSL